MSSTVRWKMLGAFFSPKGSRQNSNFPLFTLNAVFSLSYSDSWTWWKPDFKSIVEKTLAFPRFDKIEEMFGIGYLSLIVFEFNFRKSITSRRFCTPFSSKPFLLTIHIGLLYGDLDGLMILFFKRSSRTQMRLCLIILTLLQKLGQRMRNRCTQNPIRTRKL